MPKTSNTNRLMADYISQAGLTRVYVGVQVQNKDMVSAYELKKEMETVVTDELIISVLFSRHQDGTSSYMYADSTPLQVFAAWSQEEKLATNSSCVELLNTGTWSHVECETSMFFICEFPKSKRRGGRGGRGTSI